MNELDEISVELFEESICCSSAETATCGTEEW